MTNIPILIESQELAGILKAPNLVIVDCRADLADHGKGRRDFNEGHIPGAQFADLEQNLSSEAGKRGRHPLPEKNAFATFLGRLGVDDRSEVVCYDHGPSMFACRFWWMVRWLGHPNVRILDGGLQRWVAEGMDLTTEVPTHSPTEFKLRPSLTKVVNAESLLDNEGLLIDARAEDRFRGLNETMDHKAGHIPGAICRPFQNNLDEAQRFNRSASQFADLNVDSNTVCYCGSGVTACHNIVAMLLNGYPEPALYPGSWSEWIENPQRPIETST